MTAQQRLDQLIDNFDTAMLVSTSLEGKLRARPMAITEHKDGAQLFFATRSESAKIDEILRSPNVAVTLQDEQQCLSITGKARAENNRQLAEELWNPTMKIWFPEGPDDPNLTLIVIDPEYAEFWDRSGLDKMEFLWEAGKALFKGEAVDDAYLDGNAKVKIS